MTAESTRIGVVAGDGAVLRRGDTIVLLGSPTDDVVAETATLLATDAREERIRALAGMFLRRALAAAAVVDFFPGGADAFAVGAIDMVVSGRAQSASGSIMGLSGRYMADDLTAIVLAGTPDTTVPGWVSFDNGTVQGAGIVVAGGDSGTASSDAVAADPVSTADAPMADEVAGGAVATEATPAPAPPIPAPQVDVAPVPAQSEPAAPPEPEPVAEPQPVPATQAAPPEPPAAQPEPAVAPPPSPSVPEGPPSPVAGAAPPPPPPSPLGAPPPFAEASPPPPPPAAAAPPPFAEASPPPPPPAAAPPPFAGDAAPPPPPFAGDAAPPPPPFAGDAAPPPPPFAAAAPPAPVAPAPPPPVAAAPPPPPPPVAAAPGADGPAPPDRYQLISLTGGIDLTDRTPIPEMPPESSTPDAPPVTPTGDMPPYAQPVKVLGVLSPRGFFNHPEARFCSRTGVKMGASETKVLIQGERPPLGVLTFDDGSTYSMQWTTIAGRDPRIDDQVAGGQAAPLTITDDELKISRRHILLEMRDWDVLITDLDTANGTYLREAAGQTPRRLASGEKVVMSNGAEVFLGDRSFTYHEHHVR